MKALSLLVLGAVMSVAGCGVSPALQAPAQFGSAHLVVKTAEARSVQYNKDDIKSITVTVTNEDTHTVAKSVIFKGTDLSNHMNGNDFGFNVTGLTIGTNYKATVDAFANDNGTGAISTAAVTSDVFNAADTNTIDVTFTSTLKLMATPTGGTNNSSVSIVNATEAEVAIN
ncbi:MAG TPA: hypothetical protein V6D05_14800 [Stenomitos sp.]